MCVYDVTGKEGIKEKPEDINWKAPSLSGFPTEAKWQGENQKVILASGRELRRSKLIQVVFVALPEKQTFLLNDHFLWVDVAI